MRDYNIDVISNVKNHELNEFYDNVFKDRNNFLKQNWKWVYRFGYLNYEPLVLLNNKKKIIGQAGLMPAKINYKNISYPATWFVDFILLEEFRAKGLGTFLTKQWMKICPNQITYCNKSSLKIFKKLGWQYNEKSKRIGLSINYLKFIPLIKKFKFPLLEKIFFKINKMKLNNTPFFAPKLLNDNKNMILNNFLKKKNLEADKFQILRDEEWFKWRFLDCPYNKNIYYFEYENNYAIVHLFKRDYIKRLNILYSFCTDECKEDYLFFIIYKWALNNSIDLMWANSSNENFINKIKKFFYFAWIKPIIFASYSNDILINQLLKNGISNLHGSDSDNDILQINNNYN